jgi:hypothetical protein
MHLARVRASKNDFGTLFNRVLLNILGSFSAKPLIKEVPELKVFE